MMLASRLGDVTNVASFSFIEYPGRIAFKKVMRLIVIVSLICLFNIIRKPSPTKRNTLSLCWSYRLDIFFAVNYLLSDKGFLHGFTQEVFVVTGHVFCPLFYNSLLLCLSHHCLIYEGVKHRDSNAI